jgi:hypothetical protein
MSSRSGGPTTRTPNCPTRITGMRSPLEFLLIALVVTLTPGPGTATILRVAARDGRRAATSAILGNSARVLVWGSLSAIGVSSLILASRVAYDGLRIAAARTARPTRRDGSIGASSPACRLEDRASHQHLEPQARRVLCRAAPPVPRARPADPADRARNGSDHHRPRRRLVLHPRLHRRPRPRHPSATDCRPASNESAERS